MSGNCPPNCALCSHEHLEDELLEEHYTDVPEFDEHDFEPALKTPDV